MLKNRIIPTLLYNSNLQCVKPVSFQRPYRILGPLMQYIKVIEKRNVDELIILDVCASVEGPRPPLAKEISEFTKNIFCPCTIGGGIRSLDDISELMDSGADKVAIKTNYGLTYRAARKFGSQAIVGVVDCTKEYEIDHWLNLATVFKVEGAGEILLTDCSKDGTLSGYNLDLIRSVANAVGVPVIASGGCGSPSDMALALDAGASAVAAGSMFLYTETTPKDCADYLHERGYNVRASNGINNNTKAEST